MSIREPMLLPSQGEQRKNGYDMQTKGKKEGYTITAAGRSLSYTTIEPNENYNKVNEGPWKIFPRV